MYLKEFEIRWNDLDANRHLANSSYVNYMSHTRMSALIDHGINQSTLAKYNIGPVVFHEHIYYFKESVHGKIKVSFELGGASEDGMFFKFIHNFYNDKGENLASCDMQGGWMDLKTRKLIALPNELLSKMHHMPKSSNFIVLEKKDMRSTRNRPANLKL
ncbi:MAG: thioesterase family protein [Bacteroidia bacterium]|nr:thioesterase family protein [Bacteroidia bacterium]NNF30654.1 thioesterase family protein [Flavobacteriaceae bacterium]NNJ80868.1 thioesterase family protein [Flavobacteriaceae bacterium]NNK54901.1 thioesterase family protein [Flavobacteriaceae bacterium]NNM07918.1 thioesterase family protein [Flavobacteriaceae bacterium]